jgi:outer membrane usher protein
MAAVLCPNALRAKMSGAGVPAPLVVQAIPPFLMDGPSASVLPMNPFVPIAIGTAIDYVSLAPSMNGFRRIAYEPIGNHWADDGVTHHSDDATLLPDLGAIATPALSSELLGPAAPQVAMASTALQDVGAPSALPREQELQLPLVLDGSYLGDVDVIISLNGDLRVRLASLVPALSRVLRPEESERISRLPAPSGLIDAAALRPQISLILDEANIEIAISVAAESRRLGAVSLAEDPFANLAYTQPQSFAMAMAVDFGGAYSFRDPAGFRGEAGRVASWVNIGGTDGVFLDVEAFYDSEGERSFRRGDIRLSKDDPANAIRYTLGDVLYLPQGFQGAPRIGGIGVQRLYEELDPLRIIRPQGRTNFTLDRPATVEVIVNGIPFRTIRFDAGTFSINDIPFAEGGNNVELLIRDDSGIERRLQFGGYSSANLLAEGLSEFGFVVGFESDFTPGGIDYDTREPMASGFYRAGISSNLTIGANAQASRRLGQVGGELIYGTANLLIAARGALSYLDDRGVGYSWEVNTQYRPLSEAGLNTFFLEGNARGTSRDFSSLGILDPRNDFKLETAIRGGFAIDQNSNVSLGYSHQFGRDEAPDIVRYSLTASRRFGNLAAFATFDRREVTGQATENRVLLTLSLPLGNRSTYARATYDSDRNALRTELQRLPRGAVGDLSGAIAVETNRNGQELLGQLRYQHNRFIAGVDNSIIFSDAQGSAATAVTRYNVRTGFGYTDGRVLVSPTLGEGGFVAVARGRGATEGKVILNDSPIGPLSTSDALGPAVFGGIRGYVPTRITADLVTEQAGFESASQTINILPGARTGYLISLAETPTAIVIANLLKPDGTPASLLAGVVVRTDGKGEELETFTNRSGRLVVEELTAGEYRLEIAGTGSVVFTLGEDQVGIVEIGELRLIGPTQTGAEK